MDPDKFYAIGPNTSHQLIQWIQDTRPNVGMSWPNCTDNLSPPPCYRSKTWHASCEAVPCTSERGGGLARSSTLAFESRTVEQQIYSIDVRALPCTLFDLHSQCFLNSFQCTDKLFGLLPAYKPEILEMWFKLIKLHERIGSRQHF